MARRHPSNNQPTQQNINKAGQKKSYIQKAGTYTQQRHTFRDRPLAALIAVEDVLRRPQLRPDGTVRVQVGEVVVINRSLNFNKESINMVKTDNNIQTPPTQHDGNPHRWFNQLCWVPLITNKLNYRNKDHQYGNPHR